MGRKSNTRSPLNPEPPKRRQNVRNYDDSKNFWKWKKPGGKASKRIPFFGRWNNDKQNRRHRHAHTEIFQMEGIFNRTEPVFRWFHDRRPGKADRTRKGKPMTKHITKYSVSPNHAESFPDIVSRAYNLATTGRKGGVIIDFPFDIQKASIDYR